MGRVDPRALGGTQGARRRRSRQPGVYVVSCWGCSPVCCTTLEAALEWAEQLAHIDAGPLWPFIDSEIHQDGRLVCVYDCYERGPRMVEAADDPGER
jgi:hypothetical protein